MNAEQFTKILDSELAKLNKTNVNFGSYRNSGDWEVYEDDTPEQVRSYIRATLLDAVKEQAAKQLSGNHGEKIEVMWRDAIKAMTDTPETDVLKMFGKKEGDSLGGLTKQDYAITALMNGITEDELRRRVDEFRKEKQGSIAEGAKADMEAQMKVDPYILAQKFDNGEMDENIGETILRNGMKFFRPMTYQKYVNQIIGKEGTDEITDKDRLITNGVETGMDALLHLNPAGKVVETTLQKTLGGLSKARASVGAAAPYVVTPLQDGAIDLAGQVALDYLTGREVDQDQLQKVIASSATIPSALGYLSMFGRQTTGPLRTAFGEFNSGVRRGTRNAANEVLAMAKDAKKIKSLEKAAQNEDIIKASHASKDLEAAQEAFKGKYPTVASVQGPYQVGDWQGLMKNAETAKQITVEGRKKGTIAPKSITDNEYAIFGGNYELAPSSVFDLAGRYVGPVSNQIARMNAATEQKDYKDEPWYKNATEEEKKKFDAYWNAKHPKKAE